MRLAVASSFAVIVWNPSSLTTDPGSARKMLFRKCEGSRGLDTGVMQRMGNDADDYQAEAQTKAEDTRTMGGRARAAQLRSRPRCDYGHHLPAESGPNRIRHAFVIQRGVIAGRPDRTPILRDGQKPAAAPVAKCYSSTSKVSRRFPVALKSAAP